MRLWPKIADRYVLREFIATLLGVILACAVVLLVAKVFEEFDEILENHVPAVEAVQYFFFVLPYRVLEVVPLATVLAVIFSVGTLARNREMLALTSGGQSPFRSYAPIFGATLATTLLVMGLNESFVPYCQERVQDFEEEVFGGSTRARRRNIFEKGMGNTFFTMQAFDARNNRMDGVLIFEVGEDPSKWRYSLKATSAQLVERDTAPNEDTWRFINAVEHFYDENGKPIRMEYHEEPVERPMEADLDKYLAERKEPEEMNIGELRQYIRTLRLRGEDVSVYVTDWYLKLAFPFATVILGMIGFALAMRAHIASLPLSFGVGIFLSMLFYALTAVCQTLGHIAMIPPRGAALGPIVLFLALGIYLLRRSGFAA